MFALACVCARDDVVWWWCVFVCREGRKRVCLIVCVFVCACVLYIL